MAVYRATNYVRETEKKYRGLAVNYISNELAIVISTKIFQAHILNQRPNVQQIVDSIDWRDLAKDVASKLAPEISSSPKIANAIAKWREQRLEEKECHALVKGICLKIMENGH